MNPRFPFQMNKPEGKEQVSLVPIRVDLKGKGTLDGPFPMICMPNPKDLAALDEHNDDIDDEDNSIKENLKTDAKEEERKTFREKHHKEMNRLRSRWKLVKVDICDTCQRKFLSICLFFSYRTRFKN